MDKKFRIKIKSTIYIDNLTEKIKTKEEMEKISDERKKLEKELMATFLTVKNKNLFIFFA